LASQYLEDDGKKIEPAFFVPVVPMVLVNGTEGIGTGFSSFVPPYNPEDITANIRRVLSGESMTPMIPWFRGFKGTVKKGGDHEWITEGVYTVNGKRIVVTELPPGRWTQDYKEHLDDLTERKVITGYKNSSTTETVHFEIEVS
jgi:DNA topoisomerase-2